MRGGNRLTGASLTDQPPEGQILITFFDMRAGLLVQSGRQDQGPYTRSLFSATARQSVGTSMPRTAAIARTV